MNKNKAAPLAKGHSNQQSNDTPKHPPLKIELVLEYALKVGFKGFTQPEAYANYHESCLHSSISELQNRHGIAFARRIDPSTRKHFRQSAFARYWLADVDAKLKAEALLQKYRIKRGVITLGPSDYRSGAL